MKYHLKDHLFVVNGQKKEKGKKKDSGELDPQTLASKENEHQRTYSVKFNRNFKKLLINQIFTMMRKITDPDLNNFIKINMKTKNQKQIKRTLWKIDYGKELNWLNDVPSGAS